MMTGWFGKESDQGNQGRRRGKDEMPRLMCIWEWSYLSFNRNLSKCCIN